MALIDWTDNFSVKIASIDEQHKKLVALINNLYDAMRSGKGRSVVGETLAQVMEYTVVHFAFEEELLTRHNYPDIAEHQKKHAELVAKAADMLKRYQSGEGTITVEVMNFLRDWLTRHILENDKKYSAHLTAAGAH